MIEVGVFRLHESAVIPSYGTSLSACFDLGFYPSSITVKNDLNIMSTVSEKINGYDKYNVPVEKFVMDNSIVINPGDRLLIPTGLVFKIFQKGRSVETFADITAKIRDLRQFSIRLHARSGMALKRGLVLANAEGVVDVDYQQQVYILLHNISEVTQEIKVGERIAQGEVVANEDVDLFEITEYPSQHSERDGGFGSTGTH